jgi:4-hydroxymandelate oxidase
MTEPLNLCEYEAIARSRLPKEVYDYYAGGAGDEITLEASREAWSQVRLRPRILVDVSTCDMATTILGQPSSMPVMLAPCALNLMAHPDGELGVARAAAEAGIIQVLSTISAFSVEDVAAASTGPKWFQLYCYRDRSITEALVRRVEAAGYAALCLTVDVAVPGVRERDARNRFKIPPGMRIANFAHVVTDNPDGSALEKYASRQYDPSLTWDSIEWFRAITKLPIVLKGVLSAEDAALAVEHGVDGIIVSNHGGRQLDGTVTTCEALAEISDAVAGKVELYVDGGIRRGTDVLKALALGARAVLIGRPYLWALAADGEAGVSRMLEMVKEEIRVSMGLAGCCTLADIGPALISRAAS